MTDRADRSRADHSRARLLAAATDAFATKGYHATTTRDIAAAAGMSPAALYMHHRSKEEILYLISKDGHEEIWQLVRRASESHDDPTRALTQVVREFAIYHARDCIRARVVNHELNALTPSHQAEIRTIRRQIESTVRQLLDRGVGRGTFTISDPSITGTALLSLGVDLARWYNPRLAWTPDQIADQYVELALRMVGVRRRHRRA